MSKITTPSLESITIRAKYHLQETDFEAVKKKIADNFPFPLWTTPGKIGESIFMIRCGQKLEKMSKRLGKDARFLESFLNLETNEFFDAYKEDSKSSRPGIPFYISVTTIEHQQNGIIVEVECRPAMWFQISQLDEGKFTENQVQEALIECRVFVKQVMSIFKAREIEPVSVYPIIERTEIKSRLLNLGLEEIVAHLDDADKHIVQNNFVESLTSSRTAFEKMVDWQMKKRGLEQTNNYKNNLERLKAKGFVDADTAQLLQSYYHCLSTLGVHEKGTPPGFYEAQMGYGITLIVLDYFANKLP